MIRPRSTSTSTPRRTQTKRVVTIRRHFRTRFASPWLAPPRSARLRRPAASRLAPSDLARPPPFPGARPPPRPPARRLSRRRVRRRFGPGPRGHRPGVRGRRVRGGGVRRRRRAGHGALPRCRRTPRRASRSAARSRSPSPGAPSRNPSKGWLIWRMWIGERCTSFRQRARAPGRSAWTWPWTRGRARAASRRLTCTRFWATNRKPPRRRTKRRCATWTGRVFRWTR